MKNSPATSDRLTSTPTTGGLPQLPNPAAAADYDGFSVGNEGNDAPEQATPPVRTRAAKGGPGQQSMDEEDEALKRKLTICKNCK